MRDRFSIEESSARLVNFLETLKMEIEEITKATGRNDVHSLSMLDLITTDSNISNSTGIQHA